MTSVLGECPGRLKSGPGHGADARRQAAERLEESGHLQSLPGRRVWPLREKAEGDSRAERRRQHAGQGNEDNQAGAGIDTDAGWQAEVQVEEEPLARLFVTLLQRFGVETDSFAGMTGTLDRV